MVCLDLDGTLLTSKHRISEETLKVLRDLETRGVKIVVVTGRAGFDAKRHAKMISEDAYFIGSNGAVIGSVFEENLMYESPFSEKLLNETLSWAEQMKIKPVLYANNKIFITGYKEYLMHLYYAKRMKLNASKHLCFESNRKNEIPIWTRSNVNIHKIIFFAVRSKMMTQMESILRHYKNIEMALTGNGCFELTEEGVNKSYGIKKLSEYLKIDKSEIIAFGDSENDLEMIKYVGCGVAMENATSHIKSISDRVTASNDNEGIGIVLKEMLENGEFA